MKSLKFVLMFSCFSLTIYSVSLAFSDHYYRQAVKQFTIDASAPSETGFIETLSLLEKSLKFHQSNASSLDLKGEVLYRKWWQEPDARFLPDSILLQQAKELHLAALANRKEWVFSVLQIVRIESHTPQLNDEFFKWFDKAYSLGLYETSAALELFKMGIRRWSEFDLKRKEKIVELTNASIAKRGNSLKVIAEALYESRLFQYMCVRINSTLRQKSMCEKYTDG